MERTHTKLRERWGRIRRRYLRPILGPDELTELRLLTPSVRRAFLHRAKVGLIRPPDVAAASVLPRLTRVSAANYLRLALTCYIAAFGQSTKDNSERLYRAFSDGRHGGLLTIARHSPRAFAQWLSSGAYFGSHPWEIVRNSILLSVHRGRNDGYWLRLGSKQRDAVSPHVILMALGLSRAGVPFAVESLADLVLFAKGDDWIGVADDSIWARGRPVWPEGSRILNASQNSVMTSELAAFPEAMRRIRWFDQPVIVEPLT